MQTSGQTSSPQPPKPRTPKARPPKPVPPPEFDAGKIMAMQEADLIALLKKGDASEFEKAKACQRLSMVGTDAAVPAVAPLLTDTKLSHYARYALETIPGSAPDEALRAALPKVKGDVLVGVVNSIGKRGDPGAVDALTKLTNGPDDNTARAAASALGHIGSPEAARAIQSSLGETKDPVRTAVADAGLVCAEKLLARGERDRAMALYNSLVGTDIPKPVRLAAMHGIIAAETSLSRPR